MFFPKINVKNDPVRRWHRPDRHLFANGACQVLAFAFLERYPDVGFHARWIKPVAGFTGNHPALAGYVGGRASAAAVPSGLFVISVAGAKIYAITRFHLDELYPRFGLALSLPG